MATTDDYPNIEEMRERMSKTLKTRSPKRRGLIDVLVPAWMAEAKRKHEIAVDPYTPIYHALCRTRRFYPYDN